MEVTRLAPSPTGALHLGNARTFLVNWLLARQSGWRIRMRIEDLDGPRVKPGAGRQAVEDLQWLGLDWDGPAVHQSARMSSYSDAIEKLIAAGRAYPCVCSRREVEMAASAPHAEDGASVYPGTCRGQFASVAEARDRCGREPAVRFAVRPGVIHFRDQFAGDYSIDAEHDLGDFVIAKAPPAGASGWTPAYQLAVDVHDHDMGVTDVVRGDDLLDSTPRQLLLFEALGLADRSPRYYHLPLVVGPDGRRLAKRHGDTRLSYYRGLGVPPQRVLWLLARWCGVVWQRPPPDVAGGLKMLLEQFRLGAMPRGRITFESGDDARLRAG